MYCLSFPIAKATRLWLFDYLFLSFQDREGGMGLVVQKVKGTGEEWLPAIGFRFNGLDTKTGLVLQHLLLVLTRKSTVFASARLDCYLQIWINCRPPHFTSGVFRLSFSDKVTTLFFSSERNSTEFELWDFKGRRLACHRSHWNIFALFSLEAAVLAHTFLNRPFNYFNVRFVCSISRLWSLRLPICKEILETNFLFQGKHAQDTSAVKINPSPPDGSISRIKLTLKWCAYWLKTLLKAARSWPWHLIAN